MKLFIDNWRWADVPFYLRTGKRMAARVTEIDVRFRCAPFPPVQRRRPGLRLAQPAHPRDPAGGTDLADLLGENPRPRAQAQGRGDGFRLRPGIRSPGCRQVTRRCFSMSCTGTRLSIRDPTSPRPPGAWWIRFSSSGKSRSPKDLWDYTGRVLGARGGGRTTSCATVGGGAIPATGATAAPQEAAA